MIFRKILIANRGEIVNRILRASEKLGIAAAVIYSEADSGLDYLENGTEKHLMKGSTLASTYLNAHQIIEIARNCGADAIHPGYGFMAENAAFARLCGQNGICWIGPSPEVMEKMSGKESARQLAVSAGVPVMTAHSGTPAELQNLTGRLTFPVLIKAVSGGGGRGMRIVRDESQLISQLDIASQEAEHFFGDPRIFIEQYIEKAKHIEVQVIGDKHGNLVHLYERECTIQRRYQKVIEESPSPSITGQQRHDILNDAVKLARSAGYNSAGTLEFLLAPDGQHYFMEMNTRIQVEHPVTEWVTGIDLVAEQILAASGITLSFNQEDIVSRGHAIECRICAEDPGHGFDPRTGHLSLFLAPHGEGIRTDHAIGRNFEVSPLFDSLIAKIIVHGENRHHAIEKMQSALKQAAVHGVETTIEFLAETLRHPNFIISHFYTDFIRKHSSEILTSVEAGKSEPPAAVYHAAFQLLTLPNADQNDPEKSIDPWSAVGYWRLISSKILDYRGKSTRITLDGKNTEPNGHVVCSMNNDGAAWISMDGKTYRISESASTRKPGENHRNHGGNEQNKGINNISAPLPGMLSRLLVKEGDRVVKGDILAIIESMKTENQILAGSGGTIGPIEVAEGQQVKLNELILKIDHN